MAWDYPVFIIAMFALTMGVAVLLMRVGNPKRQNAGFECKVCGRISKQPSSRDWRYCPFCGAPKRARSLRDLPGGRG